MYEYFATHGSPVGAAHYTEAIVEYCEGLSSFPHRGTRRDDIRSGLRIVKYRGRAVIAFEVDDNTSRVA
ncbi:MAG: type II toxin-antitoxin system RelE/ParE family toxin [Burkholderiales bacterium]|nr:type II toxin-antitoxin system RelE/ParE family toxin [Burkholderiales bacterium]